MSILIAPSILAADFGTLNTEVEMLNVSDADYIHIDIMDGVFVPNISFGFPVIESIKKLSSKPLDFHLMIQNPDLYIDQCVESGAAIISVHYEACPHLHRTIQSIQQKGVKAGVVLNPHTPVSVLEDVIDMLDLVLIMSVNPGFGGQKFIENTYQKVAKLQQMAIKNPDLLIEVDGGVNLQNAKQLIESGANMLVAGSAIFASKNPLNTINEFKSV
ncbi:MAG: ribulose-phosphate 3-epimerase [Cyclobacteriaceae bacterium]